jgi:hypothetical protein
MELNIWAIITATIVQFVIGAAWYMGVFAKQWGVIFGFDKLPKAKQKEMQAQMGPYYILQLIVTVLTSVALAYLMSITTIEWYNLALWVWAGFVVPTQVSAVIFGGVEPRWISRRLSIMASGSLACLLGAAYVISLF